MNNDPFSIHSRRYIPWDVYKNHKCKLRAESLIEAPQLTANSIHSRLQLLTELEQSLGLAYIGEKAWLESVQGEKTYKPYSSWVIAQFQQLFPHGLRYRPFLWENQPTLLEWSAYTEDISKFVSFEELSANALPMDNIMLTLAGDRSQPNEVCVRRAFEVLHDLPYYLVTAANTTDKSLVSLDEIWIPAGTDIWHIDLISDYGSAGTVYFRGDERVCDGNRANR